MKKDIKEKLEELAQDYKNCIQRNKEFEKSVFSFINDKSITLEERWDFFVRACSSGVYKNVSIFTLSLKNLPNSTIIQKFDRNQLVRLYIFVDEIKKYSISEDIDIDLLKEEVLSHGYSAFIFNW